MCRIFSLPRPQISHAIQNGAPDCSCLPIKATDRKERKKSLIAPRNVVCHRFAMRILNVLLFFVFINGWKIPLIFHKIQDKVSQSGWCPPYLLCPVISFFLIQLSQEFGILAAAADEI